MASCCAEMMKMAEEEENARVVVVVDESSHITLLDSMTGSNVEDERTRLGWYYRVVCI